MGKGQSTNCRVEDELPLEAQSIFLRQDNDIVSATRNSRCTRFVTADRFRQLVISFMEKTKQCQMKRKTKKAQAIYDAVLEAFPNLKKLMHDAQAHARKYGYVETILGRRRHIPDMQLPEFEFKPMKGYINPDVDPLDISTLSNSDQIPQRIVDELTKEFKGYKYFGQIVKRTKELAEEHIRVINNRSKIQDASRQCVNSIIQGRQLCPNSLNLITQGCVA